MTRLLEEAFKEASQLPQDRQDELAQRILEGLADRRWDELFADPRSEALLDQLADEALADYRAGRTLDLDPSSR